MASPAAKWIHCCLRQWLQLCFWYWSLVFFIAQLYVSVFSLPGLFDLAAVAERAIPDEAAQRKLHGTRAVLITHTAIFIFNQLCFLCLPCFRSSAYTRICVLSMSILADVVVLAIVVRFTLDIGDSLIYLKYRSGALRTCVWSIVSTALDLMHKILVISLHTWLVPKRFRTPFHYEPTLYGKRRRPPTIQEVALQVRNDASTALANSNPLANLFEKHENLRLSLNSSGNMAIQAIPNVIQIRVSVDEPGPQIRPSLHYWDVYEPIVAITRFIRLWFSAFIAVACAVFEFTLWGLRHQLGYTYTWDQLIELLYPIPLLLYVITYYVLIRFRMFPAYRVCWILRLDQLLGVTFCLSLLLGIVANWVSESKHDIGDLIMFRVFIHGFLPPFYIATYIAYI
ncbi:uncharacterized protein K460DRAFT_123037 [Cucurbitaria berberidis CBS 394.84]|uniref:Uncharacterized protein n=1 Tax=Cucurbitaria berberidis CBS 394.84 TaxID=1168544 RepID=A0A9P4GJL5_9PLEO|nr:uncharacterized protein K460DRAFT_123037 [Cucurbitaria berberidis CBS 394.84]KAF1846310.1 hypothetical protein K460DRAFT_123037 [Cucurbitaria berberidis CBS 394.84]